MMKKYAVMLLALVLLGACVPQGVRYSPQELQGFPPEIQELIKYKTIALGMSQQAVRYSWGAPAIVEVKDKDGKPSEVWTYSPMRIEPAFVFVDGQLTGIVFNAKHEPPKSKDDKQQTSPATENK